MTGLIKYVISEIWLLLVVACLTNCESDTLPVEPEPDYTGHKGSVVDIDSNIYFTIGIGTQIWMAENLAATRLNDGSVITFISGDSIWPEFRQPAYSTFKNDTVEYKKVFGLLYNYYTVSTGKLCPSGWHVPTLKEWITLAEFAGGRDKAGGKLKLLTSNLWHGPNYGFAENYEFNALPGGCRYYSGFKLAKFIELGIRGYWWTADSTSSTYARAVYMTNSNTDLSIKVESKISSYNIRCVKN